MEKSIEINQRLKCGEITLNNKRKISFSCHFCVREVHSIGKFLRHILKEHLIFSKTEIDALLICAKNKQVVNREQDTSDETYQEQDIEQVDEQIADLFETNSTIMETEEQKKNEQIKMHSNEFMTNYESFINSSEYNAPRLEHNEDFSYDSSLSDSQSEECYEEFEHLEQFFEEVPDITKEEIEMSEVHNEIEVLSCATTFQHQEVYTKKFEPKLINHTQEEKAPEITNVSDATNAMQTIRALQTATSRQTTNATQVTSTMQRTNATQAPTAKQSANAAQQTNQSLLKITTQTTIAKINKTKAINVTQTTNAKLETIPTHSSQQTVHTTEKSCRIMCKICKKIFKTHDLLNVHLQRHAEVRAKPFVCEYCDALFSNKSNLNVHVKRHLGIKPYGCSSCDKSFTSSTELKLHMLKHTGSKQFKCLECNRQFSRQFQLKAHSRRHYNERPYVCKTCGNDFFDSRQLREHEKIHSIERPFSCETCGAAFKRLKALRQHNKLHLAEKSYECKICSKTFAQYPGLYAHVKRHKTKTELNSN